MGCVFSRIDDEERVRLCKERKRLMKQLLVFREDFADALLAYLRALKNTGATLRQFTESESLQIENTSYGLASPSSSPPLPLPPSPPPPLIFSLDSRRLNKSKEETTTREQESIETDEEDCAESRTEVEGEEGMEETLESGTAYVESSDDIPPSDDTIDARLARLKASMNMGATLRQFTGSESLQIKNTSYGLASPSSPPLPLPPSPPPPLIFSSDTRRLNKSKNCTPPPPPIPGSSWKLRKPFEASLPLHETKKVPMEANNEENWVESKAEFEGEDGMEETSESGTVDLLPKKEQTVELVDDISPQMSWNAEESADMTMEVGKSKKSLEGIVKNLDEYFLEASALGGDIAILVDINSWDSFPPRETKENKRKRSNSAKVVSALSWNWSSKSLQLTRDAAEFPGPIEPCKPGAHRITLENLYAAELKLYKHLKEEENTKLEYERKLLLLQKQEDEYHDRAKMDKTRLTVEGLESDLINLQESISGTCAEIMRLIDEELHPQLVALTSGLMHMWRTMYKCHKVQNHIALQLNHISVNQVTGLSSEFHRQAAVQLESESKSWYDSFCKLVTSQKCYVRTLHGWLKLTGCLADDQLRSSYTSALCALCEDWLNHLERVPVKTASEAIGSLLSGVHSVVSQQAGDLNLQKEAEKLEKSLQKESSLLDEMEKKLEQGFSKDNPTLELGPNHPLSVKRAKIEDLMEKMDKNNTKYVNSIEVTKAMALNHLRNSLPRIFQSLMDFSSAYTRAFEELNNRG